MAGSEYKLSDVTRVFASGGVSRLAATETSEQRTGPAWSLGLSHHFRTVDVDLDYTRSYVPSYGFGGTMPNEEAGGRVRLPVARRVYVSGGLSWRRNDPLVDIEPPLRSFWIEGALGYAMTRYARLEAFYGGTHQTIDRPGGVIDRNRYRLSGGHRQTHEDPLMEDTPRSCARLPLRLPPPEMVAGRADRRVDRRRRRAGEGGCRRSIKVTATLARRRARVSPNLVGPGAAQLDNQERLRALSQQLAQRADPGARRAGRARPRARPTTS